MYLFTSESVSAGHPDKCADIIADTIVDRLLDRQTYRRGGFGEKSAGRTRLCDRTRETTSCQCQYVRYRDHLSLRHSAGRKDSGIVPPHTQVDHGAFRAGQTGERRFFYVKF